MLLWCDTRGWRCVWRFAGRTWQRGGVGFEDDLGSRRCNERTRRTELGRGSDSATYMRLEPSLRIPRSISFSLHFSVAQWRINGDESQRWMYEGIRVIRISRCGIHDNCKLVLDNSGSQTIRISNCSDLLGFSLSPFAFQTQINWCLHFPFWLIRSSKIYLRHILRFVCMYYSKEFVRRCYLNCYTFQSCASQKKTILR